eukprot:SAG25_NODE_780_length_5377_cov_3.951127_6_plen_62_part_00
MREFSHAPFTCYSWYVPAKLSVPVSWCYDNVSQWLLLHELRQVLVILALRRVRALLMAMVW